jgi:pimeloyl-ACP methyl ester carboxylesterase
MWVILLVLIFLYAVCMIGTPQKKKKRLHYRIYGHGEIKCLFVVGFGTNHSWWDRQVEFIQNNEEMAAKYTVCFFDNAGTGESEAQSFGWRYSIQSMAKDAFDLVHYDLKWDEFHLIGQSMGGLIVQVRYILIKS